VIAQYGESIALRRAVWPATVSPGDDMSVLLWWSASDPVPLDYNVSVFLLDESGILRAQHDGFPSNGSAPTTTWTPGGVVFDAHTLSLPADLPSGTYTVTVKLYTWWDGAILPTADGTEYAAVGTLTVK
jgi:hypothetical protein